MGDIPVGIKYGDLGDADPGICGSTGQSIYNVEHCISVDAHKFKELGVITENGIKMTTKSYIGLHEFEKISEEEANEMVEEGDPINAPQTPYKIQPKNQGRL